MRATTLCCASYAEVSDGRLAIVGGGLAALTFPSLPAVQAPFALAVVVELDEPRPATRVLSVELTDPDGTVNAQSRAVAQIRVHQSAGDGPPGMCAAWNLSEITFAQAGRHTFRLLSDGAEIAAVSVHVLTGDRPDAPGADLSAGPFPVQAAGGHDPRRARHRLERRAGAESRP
jgi:hypothetical protein